MEYIWSITEVTLRMKNRFLKIIFAEKKKTDWLQSVFFLNIRLELILLRQLPIRSLMNLLEYANPPQH